MSMSKAEAIKKTREYWLSKCNPPAPVKNSKTGEIIEDLPKRMGCIDIDKLLKQKVLNSAEEIAVIRVGLELGIYSLEDLDEATRNSLGES